MNSKPTGLVFGSVSGILNVDKPVGITSHDVVAQVRRLTGQRKVGHAGTLDPMATGVLLLCLGQATRVAEYLLAGRKQYRAVVRLGASTDTYDADGAIIQSVESFGLSQDQIAHAITSFQGVIQQVPPPYSAIRQKGRRLYELARRGIAVEIPPRSVEIDRLELVAWESPHLTFDVTCSSGTYVRSLAHDLGQMLGVGGHLVELTRLASGSWQLQDAISLDDLQRAVEAGTWFHLLHPLDAALRDFERVDLPADLAREVSQGQPVLLDRTPETSLVRGYAPDDRLVAVLQPSRKPGYWRPKKVFSKASDI
ncbi:MAG: tRNA pseudouridine(55) synthase TruB [Anaerolineales bacterium]|nr:MAG: tRNA pseudouridine(55) synthase TruB [Anaerolineales bacterium]